jgi:DNA polymerase-3 subunit beta
MKFFCSIESLNKILGICESVISSKNSITILSNIHIKAQNNQLTIKACDTLISFYGELGADVEEEGEICVNSNKLYSIARKLPSDEIEIQSDSDLNIQIKAKGKNTLKYNLKGISPDKFPEILDTSNINYFNVPKDIFADMINKTKFAVSQNDNRRFAIGTLFEYEENKLRMVTTDGKRLAKIEKEIEIKETFSKVVVPPKILQEALKLCSGDDKTELKVGLNEKEVFINIDNCFFISNLLDSGFPSYQSVIPANSAKSFKVNRKDFKDAIDRVSVMGEKDTHKVIISLSGNTMKIYSENMTYGDGEETIDIEYDSDDIKIAFNFSYITDVISVIKNDNLIFKFNNASSTIVILEEDNPDYIYIMMPMSV